MAEADTRKAKAKADRKTPGKDERPQAEWFIEAARRIGADETGESFERAVAKIVPPRTGRR